MKKVYTTEDEIKNLKLEMEEYEKNKFKDIKKYIGKTKNILFGVVVVGLISILLMINAVKSEGKVVSFLGYSLYQVQTGSMEPTLPVGTIILTKEVKEKDKLEEGTIVTFKWDNDVVTHRIIERVQKDGKVNYKTKGDNINNSIDPELLRPENIIAEYVFKIPFTY